MPRSTVRRIASSVGAMMVALTLGAGLPAVPALADDSDPTTAPPGPAEPQVVEVLPDLRVTAAFDKPAYTSGELLKVKVTIENIGTVPATEVRGDSMGDVLIASHQWGELARWHGPGGRLEPGQVVEVDLSGHVTDANVGVATLGVSVTSKGETNVEDNVVTLTAQITAARGNYVGTVYGDRNNNGAMDQGEALNEVKVSGFGGVPSVPLVQTTGPDGRFSFRDIPTGRYWMYFSTADWVFPSVTEVTVDAVDDPDALIRAVRPQSETLAASIRFTRDSYTVGDTAHLEVTLTNSGPTELTGITAFCWVDGPDPAPDIPAYGPGWGDLVENGPGVTVPAGQTRVFDTWHIVHEATFTYGAIYAGCDFGNPPTELGPARASAKARVPGGRGSAGGLLVYDRDADNRFDGEGVANTKVILLDTDSGEVVARATTDTNGRYLFTNAPAGWHEFRVIGPWKLREANESGFLIRAGRTDDKRELLVVPGPNQPDPDDPAATTTPTAAPPAQQGGVAPAAQRGGGLASTGANVVGLSIAGLVMLVVGVGLVLIRSRRRVPPRS